MIRRLLWGCPALFLVGLYLNALLPSPLVESLQLKAADLIARARYALEPLPPEARRFVLVAIDDESLDRVNRRWPWDRAVLAEGLERLAAARPQLIGVDLVLAGETSSQSDRRLAQALRRAGPAILASYTGARGELVQPHPRFAAAASATGLINKLADRDLRVRRARAVQLSPTLRVEDYAFEVKAVAALLDATPHVEDGALRFRNREGEPVRSLPLAPDGSLPIRYAVHAADLTVVPFYRLLDAGFRPETVRDRIVLIGPTGTIFHDLHPTPLGRQPGAVVLANTMLTLLRGVSVREVPLGLQWVLLALIGLAAGWATYRLPVLRGLLATTGLIGAFLLASAALAVHEFSWDFVGVPLTVVGIYVVGTCHKAATLAVEAARLRVQATTDSLTGLANWRYFQVRLEHELRRAQRHATALSVMMFDVDRFKTANDRYGHGFGNAVLKMVVGCLTAQLRTDGLLARYGGDEFCALLFNTDLRGARECGERLRAAVSRRPFTTAEGSLRITLSIGVATLDGRASLTAAALLKEADASLYEAKRAGRNRVCARGATESRPAADGLPTRNTAPPANGPARHRRLAVTHDPTNRSKDAEKMF